MTLKSRCYPPDDEYVTYSLRNGAIGYLLKNRPAEELVDSLRALAKGIYQIDPAVSAKFFSPESTHKIDAEEFNHRLQTLTVREQEILALMVKAKRIINIAEELNIAEQTVRNHISNIYSKSSNRIPRPAFKLWRAASIRRRKRGSFSRR